MKITGQALAGIGGIVGMAISAVAAALKYDLSDTNQISRAIGFILGGLIMGAIVGFAVGKSLEK